MVGIRKRGEEIRRFILDDEKLVSRSQAKRFLDRVDKFKTVIFDFDEVDSIGQAFSDEVFRVFQRRHPDIELLYINTNKNVQKMINRAIKHTRS